MKDIVLTGANGFVGKILKTNLENEEYFKGNIWHKLFNVIPYRNTKESTIRFNVSHKDIEKKTLIHCARHHANITGIINEDKWMDEFRTDVYLPFLTTMQMAKDGIIDNVIVISSIYGVEPPKVRWIPENYVAAKAAEIHLFKYLALQLAPLIRVNIIILGGVRSDRKEAEQSPTFLREYQKKTPLNKMVQADEIYGTVKFLISKDSKGMTGSEIRIDGGYLI